MPMTREQVLAAARELSPEDRELLVYDLAQELDPVEQKRIELLWREEIRRRHVDRLSGREPSYEGETVLAELRELHGGT